MNEMRGIVGPAECSQRLELQKTVRCEIEQRTGSRVRSLAVEVVEDKIAIRGSVPSYYLKQLALQGVVDGLRTRKLMQIEFHVEVGEATVLATTPTSEGRTT